MISSASAQIEATAGERWKTTIIKTVSPAVVPDYAKVIIIRYFTKHFHFIQTIIIFFRQVQGLLIGVVAAFVIFITTIGPEYVIPFTSCTLLISLPSEITVPTLRHTKLLLKRVLLVMMP